MNVGNRIIGIRHNKGLSQYKLYNLAEISQSALSDIESNKKSPTITTLEKICKALEISLSDFFLEDNAHDNNDLDNLPADSKKELALFKEFLLYKHDIKKPTTEK
ncbi:transcriptional regulator with XRE-family HTH domain [Sporomusaceae bacterium BoRhaA]|uniref:helix-turn-helix domain-containing protein n=1 Tax=Pelorhabdus rhamnosifermentans TaxID=2772457 RepID=UPI001C061F9D|nr:helix-turn-helix domain-containing protein [Pelorhabdus rhamnosifermentans]MBU2699272.1 transcriptional regulator with XRE-family HTH domain [Pelorhabdus rhamnosifermentans]